MNEHFDSRFFVLFGTCWRLADPLSRVCLHNSHVFQRCNCRPLGGLNRVSYCVQKRFDRCSHETDSFGVINIKEVALSVVMK